MQWSDEHHAGFSTVEPWLPVGVDRATANVATQSHDAGSLLTSDARGCSSCARASPSCRAASRSRAKSCAGLVSRTAAATSGAFSSSRISCTRQALRARADGAGPRGAVDVPRSRRRACRRLRCDLRADEGLLIALDAAPSDVALRIGAAQRSSSATLQACAMQPRGTYGGSASKISLIAADTSVAQVLGEGRDESRAAAPVSSGNVRRHASTNGPSSHGQTVP